MSFNLQVRRAAEFDVAKAQVWYETQRSGLGAAFHFEFSQVITRLAETPFIYSAIYRDVRRAVVHRFPYLVWYRVLNEDVVVLACTHASQHPNKVISRLAKPSDAI